MKSRTTRIIEGPYCPLPINHKDMIVLGHGSGGKLTHELITEIFYKSFNNPALKAENDFADVTLPQNASLQGHWTISTDAHVINPLFFPGGDIGRLAVAGTVNDISMSGGTPLFLTASFIIEEGFSIETLKKIAESMRLTAQEAGIQIVAGDTKVVEKGKADKLFISTTGFGWIEEGRQIGGEFAKDGDVVLISGNIAEHGIAVMAARGDLKFNTTIQSDVAPLNKLIQKVITNAPHVHVLRDPTRGGLATSLNEITLQSNVVIVLDETAIPIKPEVRAACEMLGFDPLYVANEGKVIVIVPPDEAQAAYETMQADPLGKTAARIGSVKASEKPMVLMKTTIGGTRIVDMLTGEMLPRIC